MIIESIHSTQTLKLNILDFGATVIAIALAYCSSRLGERWFEKIECYGCRLARNKNASVIFVGVFYLLLRLLILPLCPVPLPTVADDHSVLFAADTFLHGRLSNPTPVFWEHFEAIHLNVTPTYTSMYFPGMGLMCAAGQLLFGHPWFGILVTAALACSAVSWMLQAWLPPRWALLGSLIFLFRTMLFSYWTNSYTGGATLSVIAGALVLGSLPRMMKKAALRYALWMGLGFAILVLTRPYEGVLLGIPVAATLAFWLAKGKNRPRLRTLVLSAAGGLALIGSAVAWLGYYDYRVYGSPMTLPYTVARNAYAVSPYFVWQPLRKPPVYRHLEMHKFYCEDELKLRDLLPQHMRFVTNPLCNLASNTMFYCAFGLLPCLFLLRRVLKDGRIRWITLALPVWILGYAVGNFVIPHYTAPFACVVYLLLVQAIRHMRWIKDRNQIAGRALVRYLAVATLLIVGLRIFAEPLNLAPPAFPVGGWATWWTGPGSYGAEREQVKNELKKMPGKQLVILRYGSNHEPLNEWAYNGANMDDEKIIWAKEMDAASNQALMNYYKDRTPWLVEVDRAPQMPVPYPR